MVRHSSGTGLLLLLLLSAVGEAASLTMNDFAYGMPLQVDGDGALYSLYLPQEVYRHTVVAELTDLQVFNGHGEPVPQLLLQPPTPRKRVPVPGLIGTKLYLVPTRPAQPLEEEAPTSIGEERPLIDFYGGPLPLPGAGAGEYYLADASQQAGSVARLHLQWPDDGRPLVTRVSVDVSDDLSQWRPLLEPQVIASMSLQGYHLDHHILELPQGSSTKYYRIHWPPGSRGIPLLGVKLELQREQTVQLRQRLFPTPVSGEVECHEFDLGGHFPVDGVRVVLPQSGLALEGALLSRASGTQPWQFRYRGLFYDLEREGERLRNGAISLTPQAHAQWCLRLDGGGIAAEAGLPELEVTWRPQRLLFEALGEMPFTLAFGRYGENAPLALAASRLRRLGAEGGGVGVPKPVSAGEMYELGGARRLLPPAQARDDREWALWLLLLLALSAVLLLRMRRRDDLG